MNTVMAVIRVILTLVVVALACLCAWQLWSYYMQSPWTRDGRIRADEVEVVPHVGGLVDQVVVKDNQEVKAGDVLFVLDQKRYQLAVQQAEAALKSAEAQLGQARRDQARYDSLSNQVVARQQKDQVSTANLSAQAQYAEAEAELALAQLNLARTVVKAAVNGIVTNFSLRPGNYVSAGKAVAALVDTDSYYVNGYFEETKLERIHIGDKVSIVPMGDHLTLKGKVESIAAGIEDRERSSSSNLLANINPTFSWVRLAQRVPVRIALDKDDAAKVRLLAGRTVTVRVLSE